MFDFKNTADATKAGKLTFRRNLDIFFYLTPDEKKKDFCKEWDCEYLLRNYKLNNKRNSFVKKNKKLRTLSNRKTEEILKEIVKDIDGRIKYYTKVKEGHLKDKDVSGINFCIGLLCQAKRDLKLIKLRFPKFFKDG